MGKTMQASKDRDITIRLSDRERYALALWFVEAVAPKGVTEKRTFMTVIDKLGLDEWMDKADPTERCVNCGTPKRIGLMELDADQVHEATLSSDLVRYLFKELDPEDKALARGNAVRILFALTERMRDMREAKPEAESAADATPLALAAE